MKMSTTGIYATPLDITPNKHRKKTKKEHIYIITSKSNQIVIVKAKSRKDALETIQLEDIAIDEINEIQELDTTKTILYNNQF